MIPASPGVDVDAGPLIALALIERIDLLLILGRPVWVTEAVWREVAANPNWPGAAAIIGAERDGLLTRVEAGDEHAYPQLGAGENTVLTAAAEVGALVVLDDLQGRALAARQPRLRTGIYHLFSITSLLVYAKRHGHIPTVKPLLDGLLQRDYGIDPVAYGEALRLAGEGPTA